MNPLSGTLGSTEQTGTKHQHTTWLRSRGVGRIKLNSKLSMNTPVPDGVAHVLTLVFGSACKPKGE